MSGTAGRNAFGAFDADEAGEDRTKRLDEVDVESHAAVECPYCGEPGELQLDPWGGAVQEYVTDCEVCCRPWQVVVRHDAEGGFTVDVQPDD